MYVRLGRYVNPDKDSEDFERKIKIEIHSHDLWNADQDLARIIHPLLVKFKEAKHSYPNEFAKENGKRGWDDWVLVLDSMIWAFKEIIDDDYMMKFYDERKGPEDTDWSLKVLQHEQKIQEGLMNFAFFYRSLWS